MPEKRGEFCFLKHYCQHCGQEISLEPKRLCQYEKRGYPKYIQGHQHWGNNNPMSRPEIRAKLKGRKRPDFSAWLKIHNSLRNPEIAKKKSESQVMCLNN